MPCDDAGSAADVPAADVPAGSASETGAVDGSDAEYDLKGSYTPPAHVNSGHVYSNAYRKCLKFTGSKEEARSAGQLASRIFQKHGVVTDLCGKFNAQPRKRSKGAAVDQPEEVADQAVEGERAVADAYGS